MKRCRSIFVFDVDIDAAVDQDVDYFDVDVSYKAPKESLQTKQNKNRPGYLVWEGPER
jgi:hypothetical protein